MGKSRFTSSVAVGEADTSGVVDLNDGVTILRWAFLGDPVELPPTCALVGSEGGAAGAVFCVSDADDVDASGLVDFNDGITIFQWAFLGSPARLPSFCVDQPVIPGFTVTAINAQGYAEYRHDQTGIEFVRLPGGTFEMESPDTERWRRVDEGPVHTVTLDPFLIARTEVTQAQYNAVMSVNPDYENPSKFLGDDRRPVESMSRGNLYSPDGFLALTGLGLPSEAQWKYACRGGTTTAFSWGDEYNWFDEPCSPADDYMWWIGNTPDPPGNFPYPTSPVGQKLPNPLGLFDMHGNVSEWCEDAYDATFYSKPEALGPNPVATSSFQCH